MNEQTRRTSKSDSTRALSAVLVDITVGY